MDWPWIFIVVMGHYGGFCLGYYHIGPFLARRLERYLTKKYGMEFPK
jgi:hypothetical protein